MTGPTEAGPAGPVRVPEEDPARSGQTAAELAEQLNRMSVLVEGAFATSLELLDDDAETLLAQIAARADAVVSAHRYLLMVRVRPGTPIQLHHRGLEAGEAQRLAADLWRDHPGESNGTHIVVDIASSRRRYGRLVEFPPPDSAVSPWESRVLNLYAEYAATALDIFSVLTDAKRSDATARTLLSFSESLSRVTTLDELVQLLADTVPAVTHCDQSTVYLWDADSGRLLPRARTSGLQAEHSYLGPIVPVRTPRRPSVKPGDEPTADGVGAAPEPGSGDPMTIRTDAVMIERMVQQRQVMVLDSSTDDPYLRTLLDHSGMAASVVAPLFAAGEFLGVIAANFGAATPTASIHDPDLHERLSGAGRPGCYRPPEPGAAGEGLAHGLARCPHRAAQPPALRGPGGTGAGPFPPGRRAGVHVLRRPRPLQDGQRHPGPRRRGRPHPSGEPASGRTRSGARTPWPGWAGTSSPSCCRDWPTSWPSTSWPSGRWRPWPPRSPCSARKW